MKDGDADVAFCDDGVQRAHQTQNGVLRGGILGRQREAGRPTHDAAMYASAAPAFGAVEAQSAGTTLLNLS